MVTTLPNFGVSSLHLIVISLNLSVTFPNLVEISPYLVGCRYIYEKRQYRRHSKVVSVGLVEDELHKSRKCMSFNEDFDPTILKSFGIMYLDLCMGL